MVEGEEQQSVGGGQGRESGPTRTCVGCRQWHDEADLLRCVPMPVEGGEGATIAVDWSGRAPGRGVYISPSVACVRRAIERGGFSRSLRSKLSLPRSEVFLEAIRLGLRHQMGQRLSLARRAGALFSGESKVLEGLKEGRGLVLVLASNLSAGSRRKLVQNAERKGLEVISWMTGEELGGRIGREHAGVILVEGQPFASDLQRISRQLAGVQEGGVPKEGTPPQGEEEQDRAD